MHVIFINKQVDNLINELVEDMFSKSRMLGTYFEFMAQFEFESDKGTGSPL